MHRTTVYLDPDIADTVARRRKPEGGQFRHAALSLVVRRLLSCVLALDERGLDGVRALELMTEDFTHDNTPIKERSQWKKR